MPRMNFTKLALDRLRPPPKPRQATYFDTHTTGLALIVSYGGTKTLAAHYRWHGKMKYHKLGRYPDDLGLEDARDEATKVRSRARIGQRDGLTSDPNERAPAPNVKTFEQVLSDFVELYAKPRQRMWKETERTLKVNCKKWLNRPITDITKADAYSLIEGFIGDGHPQKARITLAWLRTLYRWAWKRDIVPSALMDAVEVHIEKKSRERFFSDDEIKAIWAAAECLEPVPGAYVKLLLLLAPRKTALAEMRRSEFDNADKPTLWTTPFERTKSKKTSSVKRVYLTPLPPLASRIIRSIPKNDNFPDLVFPGRRHGHSIEASTWIKADLAEHGAPDDFTYHTARHTIATWLQNEGHPEYERGLVLNHSGGGTVTSGYSHGYPLDLKRKLLTKWANHIEKLVTPKGAALLR